MPTRRYLSQTELAARLTAELGQPVTAKTIQDWRRPDRTKAAKHFPRPGAWIGDPAGMGFGADARKATPGWRESSVPLIIAWHAALPRLADIGAGPPVVTYLSQAEMAARLGEALGKHIATGTIQTWRHRYSNSRPAAAVKVAPSFPQPDAWIGDPGDLAFGNRNATPGWRESSVAKLAAWHGELPGIGRTPRPGRRKG